MHTLTTAPSPFLLFFPNHTLFHLIPPPLTQSLFLPLRSTATKRLHVTLHVLQEGKPLTKKKKRKPHKGLCCKDWDSTGEEGGFFSPLEAEILEFMKNSKNPEAFPTREDLVAAGRVDLAESIERKGGWLAFGWDLDNRESRESRGFDDWFSGGEVDDGNATRASSGFSFSSSYEDNSHQPARSAEIESEESGIEGILYRLEKERSSSFGIGTREKKESVSSENNDDKDRWDPRTTVEAVAADLENSSRPSSLSPTRSPVSGFQIKHDQHRSQVGTENISNSLKPDMWRSWINQRTGFSDAEFEDAEIAPSETQKGAGSDGSGQPDSLKIRETSGEPIKREMGLGSLDGSANHKDIKSRIQYLELELSSILHSLRSKADKVTMEMDQKNSSDDLSNLSDAWEFQENEIMRAQDRLRSIRAKLAVLEGKMALAIMDAHKIVEEKQKRINNAHRALQILKTTCVVWPNTASEVFLVGSFDGWSSQRKMEKSSTGIFSVSLQLYPGKYEIKFIVDGEWKIDPLRPVVNNNGYENNLLVIHN